MMIKVFKGGHSDPLFSPMFVYWILQWKKAQKMWSKAKTANLQEANRIKAVFFQYIRRLWGKKWKKNMTIKEKEKKEKCIL